LKQNILPVAGERTEEVAPDSRSNVGYRGPKRTLFVFEDIRLAKRPRARRKPQACRTNYLIYWIFW